LFFGKSSTHTGDTLDFSLIDVFFSLASSHSCRCAQGTPRPIFDRAFREAADDYNRNRGNDNNDDTDANNDKAIDSAIHGVSEVGVGFRCIFGHMI